MEIEKMKHSRLAVFIELHIFLVISSAFGMCSKLAAQEEFLSGKFIFYYAVVLCNLGIYAVAWQQLIKKLPLTTAYANKAVGVIWGLIFGKVFFDEVITLQKVVGIIIIIIGIILVVTDKEGYSD